MEHTVAYELSNIDINHNLDDETLKALSIIIRTNLVNNSSSLNYSNEKVNENQNNFDHYYQIASSTSGKILETNSNEPILYKINSNFNNVDSYSNIETLNSNSKDDSNWSLDIKKSKILSYLNKNNISLSNISDITPVFDDNGNLKHLTIGGKDISYSELKREFNIKSAKISNINDNLSYITITGTGLDESDYFDITIANNLAKDNYNFEQLLNHFFNDYILKTM